MTNPMPERGQAPWNKYKWNRLSQWAVNEKVEIVARWLVSKKGSQPSLLHRKNFVATLLARGLIEHTQYGHLVPGCEREFYDVVNPTLWDEDVARFVLELDAETRLEGEEEIF